MPSTHLSIYMFVSRPAFPVITNRLGLRSVTSTSAHKIWPNIIILLAHLDREGHKRPIQSACKNAWHEKNWKFCALRHPWYGHEENVTAHLVWPWSDLNSVGFTMPSTDVYCWSLDVLANSTSIVVQRAAMTKIVYNPKVDLFTCVRLMFLATIADISCISFCTA